MAEDIGKYLQKRARKSGLGDKEIAKLLNIAKSTLEKVYIRDDISVSRLMQFCAIFGEDIFLQFYYEKEPLKSLRMKEIEGWKVKIQELADDIRNKEKNIQYLEDHIRTQNKLIASLEKEIKSIEGK